MTLKCARCDRKIEEGTFCNECRFHLSRGREYQVTKPERRRKQPSPPQQDKLSKPAKSSPGVPPPSPSPVPPQAARAPSGHPPPQQPQYPGYHPYYYQYPQHPYYYPHYQYYYNQYYQQPSDAGKVIAGLAILPSYFFLGIVLLINVIMLIVGLGYVVPYTFENVGGIAFVYPWPPYLHGITIEGAPFLAWYLFLVAIILISVIWLFYTEGKNFMKILISSAKRLYPPPSKSTNGFVMIAQLFFATIFFSYIVIIVMMIFNIPVTTPDAEPIDNGSLLPQLFYALANASVAEEFAVRILYIGIPLLIIHAVKGSTKKWYRYIVGGEFDMTPLTVFLLIFSSAVFAMAHTTNWGLWKAFPTFVAGLAMGYLYLKKGIHTSIILHFSIDYMILFLLAGMEAGEMGSAAAYGIFLVFSIIVWFFVGMVFFGVYFVRVMKFIFIEGLGTRKEPAPDEPDQAPEAIYLDRDRPPIPQKAKKVSSTSPPQPPPSPTHTPPPAPAAAPQYQYPPPQHYPPNYDPYYYYYYYYYNYYYPQR